MSKGNDAALSPFLNGKVLDIDMSCPRCRSVFVHHGNGGLVVDMHVSRHIAWITELIEDGAEVFNSLGGGYGCNEFSLGAAGAACCL